MVAALTGGAAGWGAGCASSPPPAQGEVGETDAVQLEGGTRAVRMVYGSIDVRGRAAAVGALVAIPPGEAPAGGWPIVAYAHGTTGAADDCAPSEDPSLAGVGAALTQLAAAGYLTVATDYEGLGTRGPHPYMNGRSEAQAIVDSVQAVRRLVPAAGERWVAVGYSQGGHAALWAAQVAGGGAPPLLGAVGISPVTDPAELYERGGPAVATLVLAGWLASDPAAQAELDGVLSEAGEDALDDAGDDCTFTVDGPLLDPPDAAVGGLQRFVADNVVGAGGALTVPLLLAVGTDDQLTTPGGVSATADRLCAAGTDVELRTYRGADHLTTPEAAMPDVLAWIADRFAGAEPASTC